MKTSVVIVAAGMGSRMKAGMNKQFLTLGGEAILVHTLRAFENHSKVDEIILVLKKEEVSFVKDSIIDEKGFKKVKKIAVGGKERTDSVKNGLKEVSHDGIVLIHDGARPFITEKEIDMIIEAVCTDGAAVVGTPAVNTMKVVNEDGYVIETLDRSVLWNVATPQGFKKEIIDRGFSNNQIGNKKIWDDAMLIEVLDEPVKMVEGTYENIKITTPTDLIIGKSILEDRK